jgi:hypothetical protein
VVGRAGRGGLGRSAGRVCVCVCVCVFACAYVWLRVNLHLQHGTRCRFGTASHLSRGLAPRGAGEMVDANHPCFSRVAAPHPPAALSILLALAFPSLTAVMLNPSLCAQAPGPSCARQGHRPRSSKEGAEEEVWQEVTNAVARTLLCSCKLCSHQVGFFTCCAAAAVVVQGFKLAA